MTKSDVIIVGGGPSGSAAAYHLARGGARVRVVDSSDVLGGRYKTCGGGFTEKLWWTFPRSVFAEAAENTVTNLRIRARPNEELSAVHHSDVPIAHMSMRSDLDRSLLGFAVDHGAEFQPGKVEQISLDRVGNGNGRPSVTLQGGEKLTADYLVAADGAYSLVARTMGLPRHRRQVVAVEDEAYGSTEENWSGTIEIVPSISPMGYFWVFPKADHLSAGFGGTKKAASRIKKWARDYTDSHIESADHHLSGHYIPLRDPGYTSYRDRVFIVGDAGGFVDPCTAEGISWGALSGKSAAESIVAGDPAQFGSWVDWVDSEFYAARAFRNLLVLRVALRSRQILNDAGFWQTFFKIVSGRMTYQEWFSTLSRPTRGLLWTMNRFAPL
ncbi:MAG: NAD(P)/FAD-dependent oxidoreductase [Chloroflexi bacterium]|nr:NAD(P)/FAD-dependent oxidoreductase [Chloroflexota bacterium]